MTDNTNVESKKGKKNYMPQKLKDRAYNYDQTFNPWEYKKYIKKNKN